MSIIKHVTLQKIVAHDFRYDPHIMPVLNDELKGKERETFVAYLRNYPIMCVQIRGKPQRTSLIIAGLSNQTTRNLTDRKQIHNYLNAICIFLEVS